MRQSSDADSEEAEVYWGVADLRREGCLWDFVGEHERKQAGEPHDGAGSERRAARAGLGQEELQVNGLCIFNKSISIIIK